MDFGLYDAFLSSDVPKMVDQQNSWNSLVIRLIFYSCMKSRYVGGKYMHFMTANRATLVAAKLNDLSTLGFSSPLCTSFVEETGSMSWETLDKFWS
jgi:hypothetical protein